MSGLNTNPMSGDERFLFLQKRTTELGEHLNSSLMSHSISVFHAAKLDTLKMCYQWLANKDQDVARSFYFTFLKTYE